MKHKDITITKAPSLHKVQRAVRYRAETTTDRILINCYITLCAAQSASERGMLPDDWYYGAHDHMISGYVPVDVWLITELNFHFDRFKNELIKRELHKKFTVWLDFLSNNHLKEAK